MAAAVIVEREVDCKSSVEELWRVLTETSYLNRLTGEAPRQIATIEGGDGARFRVKMKAGGFSVEWEEWPFEWVHQQRFRVFRKFTAGPVSTLDTVLSFAAREGGGARISLRLELLPKVAWLAWIVRFGARRAADALMLSVRAVDAALVGSAPLPVPAQSKPPASPSGLDRAQRELRAQAAAPELVDRLCDWVRAARDEDLARIRPYALADAWGVDRRALLTTCLHAVRAGLFELRWEVICPSCRVGAEVVGSLAAVKEHAQCHLCEIAFGLDVDEALEATFAPTAAVRTIDVGQYWQQALLPARGRATLTAPAEPGRYRLFVRGGEAIALEIAADGAAAPTVSSSAAETQRVRPGAAVTVESAHADDRHVKLERVARESQAATAREVSLVPDFRRDFSSEVLRPNLALKVSTVTLFFSDLTASTQLYSDIGDAAALRLVHDHFDVVLAIVERHGGTLVKTIGDAVMAAFVDDLSAVAASVEMLTAFETFRRDVPNGARTHLKLGVFRGPSFLVNANGVLDYFGQTVNIAARLQAQADSGELVIEATLADLAVEAGKIPASAIKQRYRATLKGVTQPLDVVRIVVAG
ncbi:MAG: Adenylate cyclase [bacterium]|nr:Adenylate cyclase [bacterium]